MLNSLDYQHMRYTERERERGRLFYSLGSNLQILASINPIFGSFTPLAFRFCEFHLHDIRPLYLCRCEFPHLEYLRN